ncbi:MAG: PorP/SprF family type IX secretion system membrane protein [Lentimicrobiaceae bacterium]|nr:PorP/SprF family type IX secretion system membrane protein [Lentimicrobiaceae bacterium]
MRIKYCLIIVFLFAFCKLFAQLDPQFSFFPYTQPYFNPGAMGENEKHLNFIGILRQGNILMREKDETATQEGITNNSDNNKNNKPGKPVYNKYDQQQVLIHLDSYIKQIRGALGIMFLKDKNGIHDNIGFRLGYASKFRVRGGRLGVGIQFGFLNQKPDEAKWKPNQTGDPTIALAKESFLDFDINFGLHYKAPTWYVGVSGTQLLRGIRVSGEENLLRIPRQLYISGGYIWDLKTPVPWSIEPHVLIQTDFATWHLHLMALARYNGILWFGVSYQLDNGIAALFGATPFYNDSNEFLKGLEIGVAYTFQTTKYAWKAGGSWGDFELVVRYGFNFYKEKALTGYGSSRRLYQNQY